MDKQKFIERQIQFIKRITDLHDNIKYLDKSLEGLHPIAVVDNNVFFVFDVMEQDKNYEFILDIENPYPVSMPEGVLAAFPLDFYQDKSTAIIAANKLENPDNYVFVFHEFVHCFTGNKYESNIRKELTIEKQQREANNMAWEMNYPFPYEDDIFINMTAQLSDISIEMGFESLINYHKKMNEHLKETDFEYMIWQEWKEGYDSLQLWPDRDVLEIGVGTGRLATKVCSNCNTFWGIDVSQKTIERAAENLRDFDNCTLICADFLEYQFENSFDVVYSSLTFIHIAEKKAAIEKASRLLKANGRFVLSFGKSQDKYLAMNNRILEIFPSVPSEIKAFFTESGLIVEDFYETEFAFVIVGVQRAE